MSESKIALRNIVFAAILAIIFAAIFSILYFLINLHFLSRFLDHDQLVYTQNIRLGGLFNPHHLSFEPLGRVFHDFVKGNFGRYGFNDIVFNLRLRSLLMASIGTFSTFLLIRFATGRLVWAFFGSMAVGFSHGYAHYGHIVDTGIFAPAWSVVMMTSALIFYRIRTRVKTGTVLLSIVLFVGVMMHQRLLLTCAGIFIALLMPEFLFKIRDTAPFRLMSLDSPAALSVAVWRNPLRRIAAGVALGVLTLLFTSVAYFYAGAVRYRLSFEKITPRISSGVWRYFTFQQWLFVYRSGALPEWGWAEGFKKFRPGRPVRGISDAFLAQRRLRKFSLNTTRFDFNFRRFLDPAALPYNFIALFVLFGAILNLALMKNLFRRYGRIYVALLATLMMSIALSAYWEPFYFEHWLEPTAIFIVITFLSLAYAGEILGRYTFGIGRAVFMVLGGTFATIIFMHNLRYSLVPQSRIRHGEGLSRWSERPWYIRRHESRSIYRHPDNPYGKIYRVRRGQYLTR